jgi:hypothetical protein
MTNSTGFIMGEAGCHHRYILKSAISNYLDGLDDNINPATGCSASAAKIASPELFSSYFGFVDQCEQILFGYPFCTSNDECYTYCFGQACQGAWNSSIGGLNHTQCFADQMHPTVASIVEYALGVPGATRDEFVAAMADQLWDYNCNGYELQNYIFPRDYSKPFGFDYRFIPETYVLVSLKSVTMTIFSIHRIVVRLLVQTSIMYVLNVMAHSAFLTSFPVVAHTLEDTPLLCVKRWEGSLTQTLGLIRAQYPI